MAGPPIPKIEKGAVSGGKIEIIVSGEMKVTSNDPRVVIRRKD